MMGPHERLAPHSFHPLAQRYDAAVDRAIMQDVAAAGSSAAPLSPDIAAAGVGFVAVVAAMVVVVVDDDGDNLLMMAVAMMMRDVCGCSQVRRAPAGLS